MGEAFKYSDYEGKAVGWMFCELAGQIPLENRAWHQEYVADGIVTIEMKINGVEVKFSTVVKFMMDQYDEMVIKTAQQIVDDKFRDTIKLLEKFRENTQDIMKQNG